MSVYTAIPKQDLIRLLEPYPTGRLLSFAATSEGVENTNYFVNTDGGPNDGRYVLTVFESLQRAELPYYLDLMAHLERAGIPCPRPIANRKGERLGQYADKPVALITCLDGKTIHAARPNAKQCRHVGETLASIHNATRTFEPRRANSNSIEWCRRQANMMLSTLSAADQELLLSEIDYQKQCDLSVLPHGTIHGDLFRDNALFAGDTLSGVIDFYYACYGTLLCDVAVAVNDWCRNDDLSINGERQDALLEGYRERRPFAQNECDMWQDVMRRTALRFWVLRLHYRFAPGKEQIAACKDPDTFKHILRDCRHNPPLFVKLHATTPETD